MVGNSLVKEKFIDISHAIGCRCWRLSCI